MEALGRVDRIRLIERSAQLPQRVRCSAYSTPIFLACLLLTCHSSALASPNKHINPYYYWQVTNANTSAASQNYGAVSSLIKKMEDMLDNAKTLSYSDINDYHSRLNALKQSALLELSRGADASAIMQPAQSLEQEIGQRIIDSSQSNGSRKFQIEQLVGRVETLFRNKYDDLNTVDQNRFQLILSDLRSRTSQLSAGTDEASYERLNQDARDFESRIMDKVMFGARKNSLKYTPDQGNQESKKVEEKQSSESSSSATQTNSKTGAPVGTNSKTTHAPKKPPLPLGKIFEQIENDLLNFHEKHQLGSFDMDSFTDKLLAEKKNLHVMMSKTGRISARQEALVRQDLEQLHSEIILRVTGKD